MNDTIEVNTFKIGQRVLYQNVICVVCPSETKEGIHRLWIDNPERGYKHWVSPHNIQPLPNGQL